MGEILVIGDPHDKPGVNQDRFSWAGELITENQPDTVVCLGDGGTFDSLSTYDVGSVHSENQRYSDDIESFHSAFDKLMKPLKKYNKRHTKWKKKLYKPRFVYCIGNHEMRIVKAAESDPKLIGTMSLGDLGLIERGWEVYPLTVPAEVHGIAFSHFLTSGILGKPISGIHHARNLIDKTHVSCVVGHSHLRDMWEDTNCYGSKVTAIVAGCYFEHLDHYSTEGDRNWRGLVNLKTTPTEINPEFIGIQEIKERYS